MQSEQLIWTRDSSWQPHGNVHLNGSADLVLAFGNRNVLLDSARFNEIRSRYPNAHIITGSTAGEIVDVEVLEDSCTVTAIKFDKTPLAVARCAASEGTSKEIGLKLSRQISHEHLKHVFVLSDGQLINGSELVKGLYEGFPEHVTITGGLAGDDIRFEKTLVGLDESPAEGNVVIVGFYGDNILVGHGTMGGWDTFGAKRIITRSENNVLYELDGKSALDLYKSYLGDQAEGLPGTALLFPLSIQLDDDDEPLVRTVLSVDEEAKSMTFAGDMPEGAWVRLMKANMDRLVSAASDAATNTLTGLENHKADLAILVSCVGRKIVLDQRVEEEVENVRDVLGDEATLTGFYSYGEISPFLPTVRCALHNQTMTVTLLSEP